MTIHGWLIFLFLFPLAVKGGPLLAKNGDVRLRLVSLAPNITEIIAYLGGASSLVGITDYCDFPSSLKKSIPSVGSMLQPSIEAILMQRPSLVYIANEGNRKETFQALKQMGIKVKPLFFDHVEDIWTNMLIIGKDINKLNQATVKVDQLRQELKTLQNRSARQKKISILWVYGMNPLIVAGKGTFINELITAAGGVNIAAAITHEKYPRLSLETVLKRNPQMIFHSAPIKEKVNVGIFWKRYPQLTAVQTENIHLINPDIVDRPGPRIIAGVRSIHRRLSK